VSVDPRDTKAGWADLEDAIGRRDWGTALKLTREFEQEWEVARGFVEIFAGPGSEAWVSLMNKAMAGLLDVLSAQPVEIVAVDRAMTRFRMFMP